MVRNTVKVIKGPEVINKLKSGCEIVSAAISTTYGPFGRNVALTRLYNKPHITKDGVTVIKELELEDPIENIAAQVLIGGAEKTAKIAGDGTSSTSLLGALLATRILDLLKSKDAPTISELKHTLEHAGEQAISFILSLSKDVDFNTIKDIAKVASNDDPEIISLVTEAFEKIGKEGIVSITESRGYSTYTSVTDGIKLDRTHINPALALGKTKTEHENPKILITNEDIFSQAQALHLVLLQEHVGKPLVIICNDLRDNALEIMLHNKSVNKAPIEIIRAPGMAEAREEYCRDLAIATGAIYIDKNQGWEIAGASEHSLGNAKAIEIGLQDTHIIGRLGDPAAIEERVAYYEDKIKQDTQGLAENFEKRLALLTAGAAVIYVGGSNEIEATEKKDRVDDTVRAVKAALKGGFVKGGGLTYRAAANQIISNNPTELLFKDSLNDLIKLVLENKYTQVTDEILEEFNIAVVNNNIIDPTLVITSTIKNAIGAALMIATTSCAIVKNEKNGEH